MVSESVTINLPTGIHARPATSLVNLIKETGCTVTLEAGGRSVNAASILSILSLGLKKGTLLKIFVEGQEERENLDKIVAFIGQLHE